MIFHPNGTNAYVINELSSTIAACNYDPGRGTFEHLQTITTIPEGYSGENIAADLHFTPDGRFLLGSNRGHDSLAFYAVEQESERLSLIDFVGTRGRTPRGFAVDHTGTFVLAANQDSHNVVTFRIDADSGTITPTGYQIQIPNPVCVMDVAEETI